MSQNYIRKCLILLTFCLPLTLFAQRPKGIVKGKVVDKETNAPLEYATITIFSKRDSSIITGDITNAAGEFSIETRPGRLYAKIEFIGYDATMIEQIRIGRENLEADLGTIGLGINAEVLAEVEVRAEKSTVQMTLDKRVFNVGKDLANTGGTAADILDNVPSVAVDIEGNVSLRGSEGVQILVDGKPSGLVGIGGSGGLRNLPANMIDKVEVITNPSAKFEAEGAAGIINIVLRKEKKKGLNGSFDFTVGYPQIYGAAINLNWRKKKLNFFTNFSVNNRRNKGGGFVNQTDTKIPDSTEISITNRDNDRGGLSGSIRLGADYSFDKNNILTTSFLYRVGQDDNLSEVEYLDYLFDLDNLVAQSFRTDDEIEDESKLEYALTYKRLLGKKGHEFVTDIRFQDNIENENSIFEQTYFDAENNPTGRPTLHQRSENEEGERRLIVKMDYTLPLGKNEKFETGLQGSFRNIKNDYLVEQKASTEEWEVFEGLSNNFNYEEKIYAGYAMYGNKINKFSYQVGARLEYSDVVTELLQTNEINPRDYLNFFPSVFFTYDLPKNNAIQISYSRRLRRPRFWYLNPFFTLSDARNRFTGNPDLDPEFTDSYEMGHIKYWDKGSLGSSVFYRYTKGVINRIIFDVQEIDGIQVAFRKPVNLATRDDIGFEFNYSYNPVKWWRISGDVNFFRSITEGTYQEDSASVEQILEADTYTMSGRMTSRTTIKKKVDVQVRFNYRGPRESTQGDRKSISSLDLGLSTDILKKNGTLTLSVRDLFNSRKRRGTTVIGDLTREEEFQWRGRTATLSLNYRLNQKKRRGGGRRGEGGYEGGGEEF